MEQTILTALRSALLERGVTIKQIAEQTGIARETLSKMLHGHKSPTLRTLCRVCGVLEITIKIKTND